MAGTGRQDLIRRYGTPILLLCIFIWVLFNLHLLHLPSTNTLTAEETDRLFWWLKYCLLPFVLAWFIMARREKHTLS